jgi:rhomboid protease GluP
MAFGISPKHIQEISLEGLSTEEFLALAIEAAKLETWEIGTVKKNGFIAYSGFSLSSYGEEIKMVIENGNATIKSECTGSQILDYGRNKNNVGNLIINIRNLKEKLSPEELTELKNALSIKEDDLLPESTLETKSKVSDILAIFRPTEGYFITPILININIVVMIIMIMTGVHPLNPTGEDLVWWGANYRAVTLDGGWWRLLTCCFLHIGIVHLLMNMYALLYIGVLLEPILGRTRFLVAYLVTGIAASATSLAWHDLIISAGASGAIFGMYGIFLAMLTTNLIEKSARKAMLSSILIFVGYNLLYGSQGSVDNAAHIGGLVSGMLVGYIFYPALKGTDA